MRKITSPSERWPGYIGISDPLTYPQLIVIQDMLDAVADLEKKTAVRVNYTLLPYLFSLVEEWAIEGIERGVEGFPGEPLDEVNNFIDWWYREQLKSFLQEAPKNG